MIIDINLNKEKFVDCKTSKPSAENVKGRNNECVSLANGIIVNYLPVSVAYSEIFCIINIEGCVVIGFTILKRNKLNSRPRPWGCRLKINYHEIVDVLRRPRRFNKVFEIVISMSL